MSVLGVDIGGTKIAAGIVTEGRVEEALELPTLAGEGYLVSRAQLDSAISQLMRSSVTAIGICAPGPLNPLTGMILNPPNLPGWRDVPLAAQVQSTFGVPCRLENDANAAGLAEALWGAAKGCRHVFYATLSTGIGTGIVIDGRIYHGRNGAAAEGGHVSLNPTSQVICNCGLRGCVEALASGTAIAQRAAQRLGSFPDSTLVRPVTTTSVALAAAEGDPCARQVLAETYTYLAQWLGGIVTLLDPDIIVLGGGVTEIGGPLFEALCEQMQAYTINPHASTIPIVRAALGRHAGLIGAAAGLYVA